MSEEKKVYRILVVENNPAHHESTRNMLSGHDVTIVSKFTEAMDLMKMGQVDEERVKKALFGLGYDHEPHMKYEFQWKAYNNLRKEAEKMFLTSCSFDVVLTDMAFVVDHSGPWSVRIATDSENEVVCLGFIIALRAALCGVKYIGMITDSTIHTSTMSSSLDFIGNERRYGESFNPNFIINGARVMFNHAPFIDEVVGEIDCYLCYGSGICRTCSGTGTLGSHSGCYNCSPFAKFGTCKACNGSKKQDVTESKKNWAKILRDLTADEQTQNQGDEEV